MFLLGHILLYPFCSYLNSFTVKEVRYECKTIFEDSNRKELSGIGDGDVVGTAS